MRRGIPLALVLCALPLLLAAACGGNATITSSGAPSKATGAAATIPAGPDPVVNVVSALKVPSLLPSKMPTVLSV